MFFPPKDHLSIVLAKYTRDLLGLEAMCQLAGNSILLFYSVSETKTSQGLAAMFEEDNLLGLQVSSKIAITISFLWSLFSFTNAHIRGLSGHRDYFPFLSKAVLLCSVFCATLVRIISITVFFSPSLGLFNLLRHYQGRYLFILVTGK